MAFWQRQQKEQEEIRVPAHLAIIMDGNGRWAKKRGLARTAGHAAGSETFRRIATYCKDIGVQYLTVYAFSTENWKRPGDEVAAIMALLEKYLHEAIEKMADDHIALRVLGDVGPLSPEIRRLIHRTQEISQTFTPQMTANICINYGGRMEILRACRLAMEQARQGKLQPDELTEERFSRLLYTADLPDPDLIIGPSGEIRLSNFLLWQCAYAELYFTDTLWPDFDRREIDRALAAYARRSRRFGGL